MGVSSDEHKLSPPCNFLLCLLVVLCLDDTILILSYLFRLLLLLPFNQDDGINTIDHPHFSVSTFIGAHQNCNG